MVDKTQDQQQEFMIGPGYLFINDADRMRHQEQAFANYTSEHARRKLGVLPKPLIIDLGCNQGGVTRALASAYHDHQVIAYDINPQFIDIANTKSSPYIGDIQFKVQDITKPWTDIADGSVGGIHISLVGVHLLQNELLAVLKEARRALAPGGRIWFREPDLEDVPRIFYPKHVPPHEELHTLLYEAMITLGRQWDLPRKLEGWLTEAGFVNIAMEKEMLPVGSMGGLVGNSYLESTFSGPEKAMAALLAVYGKDLSEAYFRGLIFRSKKLLTQRGSPQGKMTIHHFTASVPQ